MNVLSRRSAAQSVVSIRRGLRRTLSTSSPEMMVQYIWPPQDGDTHDPSRNQSSLYYGNAFADPVLSSAVATNGGRASPALTAFGAWAGSRATMELAMQAQANPPVLCTHDRNGRRVDAVAYHPSYHECASACVRAGVHAHAWTHEHAGAHVERAALSMMSYQAEPGGACPLTMTFAAIPVLQAAAKDFQGLRPWIDGALSHEYAHHNTHQSGNRRVDGKVHVVLGMSMTEKTGGSDVRSASTLATPIGDLLSEDELRQWPGMPYKLRGHKWFTSAPASDGFLTLANTHMPDKSEPALSCFLVPRVLPDGDRNRGFRVVRLKDKLGDRSNASSEVEYDNAIGFLIGPLGRGVPTIMDMVVHTRLDCALGSAGLMRQAYRHALWYCSWRAAFGSKLIDAPAMVAVLAELAAESAAAVAASMRLARAFDHSKRVPDDAEGQAFRRLATAVTKFWVCKRTPAHVYECLESIGGNGYVEEWHFPRWFRQSPLNSVWEGSGNVIALDILRTTMKEPAALPAFLRVVHGAAGVHPLVDAHLKSVTSMLHEASTGSDLLQPLHARYIVEQLAVALQAASLVDMVRDGRPGMGLLLQMWAAQRLGSSRGTYGAVGPRSGVSLDDMRKILAQDLAAMQSSFQKPW